MAAGVADAAEQLQGLESVLAELGGSSLPPDRKALIGELAAMGGGGECVCVCVCVHSLTLITRGEPDGVQGTGQCVGVQYILPPDIARLVCPLVFGLGH